MKTILIAEDDVDIVELLRIYLENAGFNILTAGNGKEAVKLFSENACIDLVMLDIMMPQMNGYEALKRIRENSSVPVIFLTAKISDADKILGLNLGADDYISKPFNPLEVVARANAILRRTSLEEAIIHEYKYEELVLNLDKHLVTKDGVEISLTGMEFKLLQFLMSNVGRVYTKAQIYEKMKGDYLDSDEKTIMVHISNLRDKIETDSKNPKYIQTVWGLGYKFGQ